MEKMFVSATLSYRSYSFPLFRDHMNKLAPPVKGVAMKIRKLFREIEISNEPLRTSNYVRCLSLQGYEPGMQYDAHADGYQKFKTSTKAVYVTQLSDTLIIQLNIFKYSGDIIKKVVPNLGIDEEISVRGNRIVLASVIYHEGVHSHLGHYSSGVKVDNTWILISDTTILRQRKLQCSSKDISVPYILIYERITNFLIAPPISLNGTAEAGPTSPLIRETTDYDSTIRSSETRKAESKIHHYSGRRENRFK